MSREKTPDEIRKHKASALNKLDTYLDSLIDAPDKKLKGKADKISYWVEDWTKFLEFEPSFAPKSLRRYKRGEIIKVHLGFNVGSEEGGLHYAVVVEKDNPKGSPVVTIVPLTSVKPHTDISCLRKGNIFLGNELFTKLSTKISDTNQHLNDEIDLLGKVIDDLPDLIPVEKVAELRARIKVLEEERDLLDRMRTEVSKMKVGSIALVNQITTISKIRIYDPKTDHDILSSIKLSNEKLDLLDEEIRKQFTNL